MSELALEKIQSNKRTKDLYLDLSNCDLIKLPLELSECIWLKELHIGYNKHLSDIFHLMNLENLEKIYASNTNIHDLSSVSNLKKLKLLNISNTSVYDLTPLKGLLTKGMNLMWSEGSYIQVISIGNCPILIPPSEIIQQGTEVILRYFEQLEKEGIDQIYEAKLLLIGEGGAGKTSLCRKLFIAKAEWF